MEDRQCPEPSRKDLEKQAQEWESFETSCLVKGECPYGGTGPMQTVMDAWQRRVLMCGVCDCFGYPLVMSDAGDTYGVLHPEIDAAQKRRAAENLTEAELDW